MIEWTVQAVDDAASKLYGERQTYDPAKVRAALDAAVKAQGIVQGFVAPEAFFDALDNPPPPNDKLKALFRSRIRAEALEEAARELEKELAHPDWPAAIRALKDKTPEPPKMEREDE